MGNIRLKTVNKRMRCPVCESTTLIGKASQVTADTCEMWYECARCGHDPHGSGGKVETVWGWQEELSLYALEAWVDATGIGSDVL